MPETVKRWGYVVTTFKRPRIDESGSNLDQNLDCEVINEAIKTKPGINKPCLIKAVGKSRATVERAIAALVVAQKIEHRGSKKTGGYYAVE